MEFRIAGGGRARWDPVSVRPRDAIRDPRESLGRRPRSQRPSQKRTICKTGSRAGQGQVVAAQRAWHVLDNEGRNADLVGHL